MFFQIPSSAEIPLKKGPGKDHYSSIAIIVPFSTPFLSGNSAEEGNKKKAYGKKLAENVTIKFGGE